MSPTDTLARQLQEVFGERLKMIAAFGGNASTCAIVQTLTITDLDQCAAFGAGWKRLGLDPPLLILVDELPRALDAFPLEFNEIVATRRVIFGTDVFESISVSTEDLRRACEVQARGHLVHLREGYIEAAGDRKAVAQLVSAAVAPFRALVSNVARLSQSTADDLLKRLDLRDFEKGFPESLRSAERLVDAVDRWGKT
jgi:hypothetical protein